MLTAVHCLLTTFNSGLAWPPICGSGCLVFSANGRWFVLLLGHETLGKISEPVVCSRSQRLQTAGDLRSSVCMRSQSVQPAGDLGVSRLQEISDPVLSAVDLSVPRLQEISVSSGCRRSKKLSLHEISEPLACRRSQRLQSA